MKMRIIKPLLDQIQSSINKEDEKTLMELFLNNQNIVNTSIRMILKETLLMKEANKFVSAKQTLFNFLKSSNKFEVIFVAAQKNDLQLLQYCLNNSDDISFMCLIGDDNVDAGGVFITFSMISTFSYQVKLMLYDYIYNRLQAEMRQKQKRIVDDDAFPLSILDSVESAKYLPFCRAMESFKIQIVCVFMQYGDKDIILYVLSKEGHSSAFYNKLYTRQMFQILVNRGFQEIVKIIIYKIHQIRQRGEGYTPQIMEELLSVLTNAEDEQLLEYLLKHIPFEEDTVLENYKKSTMAVKKVFHKWYNLKDFGFILDKYSHLLEVKEGNDKKFEQLSSLISLVQKHE